MASGPPLLNFSPPYSIWRLHHNASHTADLTTPALGPDITASVIAVDVAAPAFAVDGPTLMSESVEFTHVGTWMTGGKERKRTSVPGMHIPAPVLGLDVHTPVFGVDVLHTHAGGVSLWGDALLYGVDKVYPVAKDGVGECRPALLV